MTDSFQLNVVIIFVYKTKVIWLRNPLKAVIPSLAFELRTNSGVLLVTMAGLSFLMRRLFGYNFETAI